MVEHKSQVAQSYSVFEDNYELFCQLCVSLGIFSFDAF